MGAIKGDTRSLDYSSKRIQVLGLACWLLVGNEGMAKGHGNNYIFLVTINMRATLGIHSISCQQFGKYRRPALLGLKSTYRKG